MHIIVQGSIKMQDSVFKIWTEVLFLGSPWGSLEYNSEIWGCPPPKNLGQLVALILLVHPLGWMWWGKNTLFNAGSKGCQSVGVFALVSEGFGTDHSSPTPESANADGRLPGSAHRSRGQQQARGRICRAPRAEEKMWLPLGVEASW